MAALLPAVQAADSGPVAELRIYTAAEGKWDKLLNRFKEHTVRLFEKHGMTNVGYWQPLEGDEPKLYYILSFKDAAAREQAWKDFIADCQDMSFCMFLKIRSNVSNIT